MLLGGDNGHEKKILKLDTSNLKFEIFNRMIKGRRNHEASVIKLDFKTIILCR